LDVHGLAVGRRAAVSLALCAFGWIAIEVLAVDAYAGTAADPCALLAVPDMTQEHGAKALPLGAPSGAGWLASSVRLGMILVGYKVVCLHLVR